ncbi:DUF4271 domain-containing protein [Cnuella takakiae]|uniref:DUF4271 domain-containing protein n=1 Tax=Cnuella takakiae TaxID=1302690 RepID=UPI0009325387|nr:DUF4271 domain-containing protein [Cnuella takakiae]OLY93779.1 hypothetical protein BUE76_19235 [Cnuella takakiae]
MTSLLAAAQQGDSILVPRKPRPDSAAIARNLAARARQDSIRKAAVQDSLRVLAVRDSIRQVELIRFVHLTDTSRYNNHPYYRFTKPEIRISQVRRWEGKEGLFYGIVALVLIFGLLRNAFARYLADLFRTYFRTTLRQRLIKEQVANAPLPSLLFNLLFLLIGALLVVLLLRHFQMGLDYPFWMLFLYSLAALALMYGVKFVVLKVFGWLLHAREATDTYIFVVFTTNKIMGILLLPVVLGLAFTAGDTYQVFYALSLVLVGGLFLYRFYLSFVTVQKLIQINLFHFLLYFCGFELAPLLLINKLLVQFFAQTP